MLDIVATCLVITALLAYLNQRFVGLPTTIGVMVVALDALGIEHSLWRFEESLLLSIDFAEVLMQGMRSLLLFAGALLVDLSALKPTACRLPCWVRSCRRWWSATECGWRCRSPVSSCR